MFVITTDKIITFTRKKWSEFYYIFIIVINNICKTYTKTKSAELQAYEKCLC